MENHLSMQKFKLIKEIDYYNLQDEKGNVIGTSYQFKSPVGDNLHKLSKQNCDSLFGVVDVEKLFNEVDETIDFHEFCFTSFKLGFNKAMELNKDKVFTEDDVNLAFVLGKNKDESRVNKLINSRLQPTEMEVMIVMQDTLQLKKRAGGFTNMGKPKLDSGGCLILKKI
jgi:hypothetical protein